ncbi:MAG TPA: hypothetical protein VFX59_20660 [Polyangiales bacterium]|nr:hypothetical protein [Polyangiales bacterium]
MKPPVKAAQPKRDLIRKLVAAEILAKRGEGPLALRPPPKRPSVG